MSLSPVNVKRTCEVRNGCMEYRMEVELGGGERVSTVMHIPGRSMGLHTLPPEVIEYELQSKIIDHIRNSLFPRK